MKTTPLAAAAGLAVALPSAHAQVTTNWVVQGPADFFNAANWDNGVPTLLDDAFINGTAQVADPVFGDIAADSLTIGSGGTGALFFASDFQRQISVGSSLNVGYTASGAAPSDGFLFVEGFNSDGLIGGGDTALARVGVTDSDGDAVGSIVSDFELDSSPGNRFDTFQVGVSNGAGAATGSIDGFTIENSFFNLQLGVTTGPGDATGSMTGWFRFAGADASTGIANIGVSNGTGNATGLAIGEIGGSGGVGFKDMSTVNVGIANSDGDAHGELLMQLGMIVGTLNMSPDTGTAGTGTSLVTLDSNVSQIPAINMGDGATLQLNMAGNSRGGDYAAINTDNAAIDGTLRINFIDNVDAGRFELINSSLADGIDGVFDTVEYERLNQGFTPAVSTVVDGGVEKVVLDLVGSFARPAFTNPASGDWFDADNWSTPFAPGTGEITFIGNGGEAVADSSTAPGPMESLTLLVGPEQRPQGGAITSNGVDLNVGSTLLVGYINPGLTSDDPAIGALHLTGASVNIETTGGGFINSGLIGINYNFGHGETQGTLNMDGGSLRSQNGIQFGFARPQPGQSATAIVSVGIAGDGVGVTVIDAGDDNSIDIGNIDGFEANTDGVTDSTVSISDATVVGNLNVGEVDIFDPEANGNAMVDLTLTNVVIQGAFDMGEIEADNPSVANGQHSVLLTNVSATSPDSSFNWFDTEADDAISFATSSGVVTFNGLTFSTGGDFELGFSDAEGNGLDGTTLANTSVQFSGFGADITCDQFEFGEADAEDMGTASTTVSSIMTDSSVSARTLEIGRAYSENIGNAFLDVGLEARSSQLTASESAFIGVFEGVAGVTPPGAGATVEVELKGSTLSAPILDIGATNEPGLPLDATLSLNPSLVTANVLTLGADGAIVFGIEGIDRVTAGTVGTPTYSGVDAGTATLDGEIVVDFGGFTPPDGTHTFDLIVASSGIGGAPAFRVVDFPTGFNVDFFAVVGDEADTLRLIISGGTPCNAADLAPVFGVLDLSDINVFITSFVSQLPIGDLNGDGIFDLTDVNIFIQVFTAGCP